MVTRADPTPQYRPHRPGFPEVRFELTILGTASQAPTRDRGQGGYLLRWGDELVLFDPGEGCQRQILLAGMSAAAVTRVCITHFHGDHCLGLPGFLQSRALITDRRIALHYPTHGQGFVDHLLAGSLIDFDLRVDLEPLDPGDQITAEQFVLTAAALDHTAPAIGYRFEGPVGWHLVPDRLERAGMDGEAIGEMRRSGRVLVGEREVGIRSMSEQRGGPTVAFVMDTRPCVGAAELAAGADLLICEATYLAEDAALAEAHGHMTATQAATLAADADVGLMVMSHFSNRYDDLEAFTIEARETFPAAIAAEDLSCISWTAKTHRV